MELITENQLVGDGSGGAFFRNLFEKPDGSRVSIKTSRVFDMQAQRKLGEEYPPEAVLFERFKLNPSTTPQG